MPAELVVRTFELGQRPLPFAETEMVMGFTPIPDDGTPPPSGTPIRNGRAQLRAEVDFDAIPEDGLNRSAHVALEVFDTATGKTVYTMPFAEAAGIEPTPFRGRR
jgi:hypothetical protein